jgi:16S rRNA (cytosine967-C5)-methyltransferase
LYVWANPFAASFAEAMDALEADGAGPRADVPAGCIRVEDAQAAVRGSAVGRGLVLVTDAAAQLAPIAAGSIGGVVIDVAAGRGTKTAQLQAACVAAGAACDIYALDIHEFKVGVLTRRMHDLGVPGVTGVVGDATDIASIDGLPALSTADVALLDAPCSGLGSLRRRPEKRWRVTTDDIERLAVLQVSLLEQSTLLVRIGGRVVYSTCTVSRAENRDVVEAVLARCGGTFATVDISSVVPAEWAGDVTHEGWFQSVPRIGGPDGHFVAVLERVE